MLRKKLLLIVLLIVGCDEPSQHGCIDSQACNYDADAEKDDGSCIYSVDNYNCHNKFIPDVNAVSAICTDLSINYNSISTRWNENGRLSYLNIKNKGVSGEIPESIGNLTELTHLWLSYNQLYGEIPENFKN